jgi:NADH dehydrogenase FAD-containing subunit
MKGLDKEVKSKLGYDLDIDRKKEYVTATERQYFYFALQYAIENKIDFVKVGRIKYKFDFDKLVVSIGHNRDYKGNIITVFDEYKMKKI